MFVSERTLTRTQQRHHLSHRALGTILNISYRRVSSLFTEVMESLQRYTTEHLKIPDAETIQFELSTEYSRLVYPGELVLVGDGGYAQVTQCPSDALESQDNWSGQKNRPLKVSSRYLSIVF